MKKEAWGLFAAMHGRPKTSREARRPSVCVSLTQNRCAHTSPYILVIGDKGIYFEPSQDGICRILIIEDMFSLKHTANCKLVFSILG